MWQKFTERARRVILLAQEEAAAMKSDCVGTEHLLLGLLSEKDGVAAHVLAAAKVSYESLRLEVQRAANPQGYAGEPKLTRQAKRVLELAADEARRMRHNYIGTEHLLLALLREEKGDAAKLLRGYDGARVHNLRQDVLDFLGTVPLSPELQKILEAEQLSLESNRMVLKAAFKWAVDNDQFELAEHLKNAVMKVEREVAEYTNEPKENSEGA